MILAISMESDIIPYPPENGEREEPAPTEPQKFRLLQEIKGRLMINSATYFLLTELVHHNVFLRNLAIRAGLIVPNLQGLEKRQFDPATVASSVEHTVRVARRYDTTVVIIPSRSLWLTDDRRTIETRYHEAFVTALRARYPRVLDLREAFEKAETRYSTISRTTGTGTRAAMRSPPGRWPPIWRPIKDSARDAVHRSEFLFGLLPITVVGYFLFARFSHRIALGWLSIVSLFFYGWWKVEFVPLLLLSTLVNYAVGRRMMDRPSAVWLAGGVAFIWACSVSSNTPISCSERSTPSPRANSRCWTSRCPWRFHSSRSSRSRSWSTSTRA